MGSQSCWAAAATTDTNTCPPTFHVPRTFPALSHTLQSWRASTWLTGPPWSSYAAACGTSWSLRVRPAPCPAWLPAAACCCPASKQSPQHLRAATPRAAAGYGPCLAATLTLHKSKLLPEDTPGKVSAPVAGVPSAVRSGTFRCCRSTSSFEFELETRRTLPSLLLLSKRRWAAPRAMHSSLSTEG